MWCIKLLTAQFGSQFSMCYSSYISVSCKDCKIVWKKRSDSIKIWQGRCNSCRSKEYRNRPDVAVRMARETKERLLKNGVIPNAHKFDGSYAKEKHWNWKGGITPLYRIIRTSIPYQEWRQKVFRRDKGICQICRTTRKPIHADHIKQFALIMLKNSIKSFVDALNCKELWDIDNGRTLCLPCHSNVPVLKNSQIVKRLATNWESI